MPCGFQVYSYATMIDRFDSFAPQASLILAIPQNHTAVPYVPFQSNVRLLLILLDLSIGATENNANRLVCVSICRDGVYFDRSILRFDASEAVSTEFTGIDSVVWQFCCQD